MSPLAFATVVKAWFEMYLLIGLVNRLTAFIMRDCDSGTMSNVPIAVRPFLI